MSSRISLHLVCFAVCLSLATANAQEHSKDSLETVKKNVADQRAVLVDVREKAEWDKGHVSDAVFLPLSDLRNGTVTEDQLKKLPKDRIVYTHCAVGKRSLQAAKVLAERGYEVRPLKQGYNNLIEAGFQGSKEK
ncbi:MULTISPECIES: rhodanese-like domain-containing protein [unclassified Schlesneria]|uniref:rhodanese-like domain-containing protein n=1 Tax=unclassified Schlesneria TaxID=2762017 RepID=UPI002F25EA47